MRKVVALIIPILLFLSCQKKAETSDYQTTIPAIYITAESAQADSLYIECRKKIPAYAVFVSATGDTLYNDSLVYIKSRGNSTFTEMDKKAFAIKLPHKTKFPHLKKAKRFILLANAFDESHIRTAIGLDLARLMGLQAPKYIFTSLYINGEYKGLYQMTNKIEVGKRSVNIHDLEEDNKLANPRPLKDYTWFSYGKPFEQNQIQGRLLENNPADISGGYLLSCEQWKDIYLLSESGFITELGDIVSVESPKHASEAELRYIRQYFNEMMQAILDTTNLRYCDLLDVESFARYYLLQEIMCNLDAGIASFFMYKDRQGKMVAGPVWDMDRTLNDPYWEDKYIMPNMIWASSPWGFDDKKHGGLLYCLCQRNDFMEEVRNLYFSEISPSVHQYIESATIDSLVNMLSIEAERDYRATGNRQSADYVAAVVRPVDFLQERIAFLDKYFLPNKGNMVCLKDVTPQQWGHHINIEYYYDPDEPIYLPKQVVNKYLPPIGTYNHDPIPAWFVVGTDIQLVDGMILTSDYEIENRGVPPSWLEVQRRRVIKKWHKIFG